jgi:hypothetical protein
MEFDWALRNASDRTTFDRGIGRGILHGESRPVANGRRRVAVACGILRADLEDVAAGGRIIELLG